MLYYGSLGLSTQVNINIDIKIGKVTYIIIKKLFIMIDKNKIKTYAKELEWEYLSALLLYAGHGWILSFVICWSADGCIALKCFWIIKTWSDKWIASNLTHLSKLFIENNNL